MRRNHAVAAAAAAACAAVAGIGIFTPTANATPYASQVTVTGTTVNFILNENADTLTYSINGGPAQPLTGTKGAQTFNLNAPTDTFTIRAANQNTSGGYNVPNGGQLAAAGSGLSQLTNGGTLRQTSDDANNLTHYNSPRGVSVSNNPNSPNFGNVYISNSAAGTPTGRTLGDGIYAVHPDQTDAYGFGDTAAQASVFGAAATSNTAYKLTVANDGQVYVTGFGDALSNIWVMPANMSSATPLFPGNTGPTPPPAGQNHGSTLSTYVTGSLATNNLQVWSMDEDLTTNFVTGAGATDDFNSIWHYNIGGGPLPYSAMPDSKISTGLLNIGGVIEDFDKGADGKWYTSQSRADGLQPGLRVFAPDGQTLVFDSREASRAYLNDNTANDIIRNVNGISVSPDQKFITIMLNNSDVAVVPLVNGIPDIANRLLVDTGPDVTSGRDIATDAAGNIHYVSSGQGLYRVLAGGGAQASALTWNGTSYSFTATTGSLYWDTNGTAAGAGGATPTGNWDGGTSNFNTDPAGGANVGYTTATTSLADEVVFAAGTDGTGSYTVNVSGSQSARMVTIPRGNVTLAGGTINAGSFNIGAGATGTVTSAVTGGLSGDLTKGGPGTLNLNGSTAYIGKTTVLEGTLVFNNPHNSVLGVDISNNATAKLGVSLATPNNNVLRTPFLTTRLGGKLDITNNKVIVTTPDAIGTYTGTAYTGVTGQIASGRNGGNWSGSGIVTSQTSATQSILNSIGVATAQQARNLANPTDTAVFGGQTVTGTDTLVMYTYGGDANLDGKVDISDYGRIDFNIPLGVSGWYNGDFNYDGKIDISDYGIIDFNIGIQGPQIPSAGGVGAVSASGVTAVPEPATVSMLALAALGLLGSRRRRQSA